MDLPDGEPKTLADAAFEHMWDAYLHLPAFKQPPKKGDFAGDFAASL
jgi:hypothetical protein